MQQPDLLSYRPGITYGHGGCPGIPSPDRAPGAEFSCEQSGRAATYPNRAGWKDWTTSLDAAVKIETSGRASRLRDACFDLLTNAAMTPKEIALALGEEITNVRPRLTELFKSKKIRRTGDRRDAQHVLAAGST